MSGWNDDNEKRQVEGLRKAYEQRGVQGYWEQEWEAAKGSRQYYRQAKIEFHLGHTNEAFSLLKQSYESNQRSGGWYLPDLYTLLTDEVWDGVHKDPRYKDLLDKLGFSQVMPRLKE